MNYHKSLLLVFLIFVCFKISFSQSYCGLERFTAQPYTLGIDIANGSMILDWDMLKAKGVQFVYMKKSYGDSATRKIYYRYVKADSNCVMDSVMVNPGHYVNYKVIWDAAKSHGLVRGVYHYWLNNKPAETQAAEFLKGLDASEFESDNTVLPPVLDLEDTTRNPNNLDESILKWISIVESALHRKVIIYAGPTSLWNAYLSGSAKLKSATIEKLKAHNLWAVQLKDGITEPNHLSWDSWTFWQYCHDFKTEFNSGEIDLNVFNGSYEELLKYNAAIK